MEVAVSSSPRPPIVDYELGVRHAGRDWQAQSAAIAAFFFSSPLLFHDLFFTRLCQFGGL